MKSSLSRKLLWIVFIVLVVGGAIFAFRKLVLADWQGKKGEFTTVQVQRGELVQRLTVAGVVVPFRRTIINAPYNGYVKKLYVKVGDRVKKNSPIVSIVQSLQSRSEEVFPLRAPFPGTVVQVLKSNGEYVQSGDAQRFIARIDDLSRLFIQANVPEIDVVKMKVGQEAVVKVSAYLDRPYRAVVREIALAATETQSGTSWYGNSGSKVEFPVKLEILDADDGIKPGMSTVIDVIAKKITDVLTLRHEFIQRDGEEYFVVFEDGERKKVQVGAQNEEMFEIKAGVKEGDRVRQTDFLSLIRSES